MNLGKKWVFWIQKNARHCESTNAVNLEKWETYGVCEGNECGHENLACSFVGVCYDSDCKTAIL